MTFENIKGRLNEISEFLDLNKKELDLLLNFERIKKESITLEGKEYPAFRILHNSSLGPGKGGIRFHPEVSEDEVKSLAFWMSLKNSLAGLPYGGAKGGIKLNPKELSKMQLERISRAYIQKFHDVLGQDIDVPAPDVYTNEEVMAWMLDEYEKIKQKHEPAMITGKPVALGGIALRQDATAKGGLIVLKEFIKKNKINNPKIAVQGFGNAGMNIAKMLDEAGFSVIAVSDSQGGVLNKNQLNLNEIIEIKNKTGSVINSTENKISNEELLELECDVLILAALENQISEENADNIKAKYILELANGPITQTADRILFKKGIIVIPDILANAGGVIVSYFEWAQNRSGGLFNERYLDKKLGEIMKKSFDKVYALFEETELDMRKAAYVIAVKRILGAERARGRI